MNAAARINVNIFQHNNRTYMEVKPVEDLMRSNLIADVVRRGDRLAVDMNSGKLTILPGVSKAEAKQAIQYGLSLANGNVKVYDSLSALYAAITKANIGGYKVMTVSLNQGGEQLAAVSSTRSNFEGFLTRLDMMLTTNTPQ